MISIGIDPGINGGVCILDSKPRNTTIHVDKCPKTVKDMADYLSLHVWDSKQSLCIIEKVHSFPGQGVVSTWTFAKNYGQWLGILASLDIPYIEVPPKNWMKFYGAMPKDKKERKNHLKHLAQGIIPQVKVTLYIADAILLANYCKRQYISVHRP
jgi:hypothetical protein